MSPAWLGLTLAYAGLLVLLEFRRPDRSWRRSRMLAVAAAATALSALAATHIHGRGGNLTLLTPGAPLSARSRDAVPLERIASVPAALADARALRVSGWGLLQAEWPDSVTLPVTFDPAPLPPGITALERPTEVAVGAPLLLRGRVTPGSPEPAWVVLEDPAGPRDSARVGADTPDFLLRDRPRAPGPASYRLRLRGAGLPVAAETLGVAVRPDVAPAVLVLDAAPSFETAFLKRWLADRGARVTIRTALSRGHYRTERINDHGTDPGRITPDLLGHYDVVLADGGSLAALAPAERACLRRAVREAGLGLLVTADPLPALAPGGWLPFRLTEAVRAATAEGSPDHRVVRPGWAGEPRRSRTGIEAEVRGLARTPGMEPLLRDESGGVLAAAAWDGMGRVGISLLRTPSRWVLEGEDDLFASYWLELLQAVARDTLTRVTLESEGPMRVDLPVTIRLIVPASAFLIPRGASSRETRSEDRGTTSAPAADILDSAGHADTIPLAQSPFDPRIWTGRYWPRQAGWHSLRLGTGRLVPFRVTRAGEWSGLEASARLAASRGRGGAPPPLSPAALPTAWLRGLAFLLLLGVLTALWTEHRRRSG